MRMNIFFVTTKLPNPTPPISTKTQLFAGSSVNRWWEFSQFWEFQLVCWDKIYICWEFPKPVKVWEFGI